MPWAVVIGGIIAGSSAEDAEDAQYAAAQEAQRRSGERYNMSREDYKPFLASEKRALAELNALYGFDAEVDDEDAYKSAMELWEKKKAEYAAQPYDRSSEKRGNYSGVYAPPKQEDFKKTVKNDGSALSKLMESPGYQFGLNQGYEGIGASASARGNLFSGRTMKAVNQFGQDYASTKFNEHADRLSNMAGRGSVNSLASLGMNYNNSDNNNLTSMANATAASRIAMGNIYGSTLAGMGRRYAGSQATKQDDGYNGYYYD